MCSTPIQKTLRVGVLVLGVLVLLLLPLLITESTMVHAAPPAKEKAESADLLDINTAPAEQLKALPEIGDTYSEKIIKNPPYARKDE